MASPYIYRPLPSPCCKLHTRHCETWLCQRTLIHMPKVGRLVHIVCKRENACLTLVHFGQREETHLSITHHSAHNCVLICVSFSGQQDYTKRGRPRQSVCYQRRWATRPIARRIQLGRLPWNSGSHQRLPTKSFVILLSLSLSLSLLTYTHTRSGNL